MGEAIYDTAIIGGGLAGLSLSILLADQGLSVLLLEKEKYPFHKVCGEYISMESWDFLSGLGVNLNTLRVPLINKLIVTAPDGTELSQSLDMGGFGISRYKLDNILKEIAESKGVKIIEDCKADSVIFGNELFIIRSGNREFISRVCCGSYGKRSNLDIKWNRHFINRGANKLNNYIGVKYHIRANFPADSIALHNFENGYCGISKIEDDKYCLCYLTNAANLNRSNNSIEEMEANILGANPHLRQIFATSTKLYTSPLTISQVSFEEKTQVEDHVLMLGDAAGLITPLCGNGMSMAMNSSKIASLVIQDYLHGNISRAVMETEYTQQWKKTFNKRIRTGRFIQSLFGRKSVTNVFIRIMKIFPFLTRSLIRQTHGQPF